MTKSVWKEDSVIDPPLIFSRQPSRSKRCENARNVLVYSLGHIILAMVVVFCIIAIPLYEPTSNFSLKNLTWMSFHFGLASAAIFIQIVWFTKLCEVEIQSTFAVLIIVDMLIYCCMVFGQMFADRFPIPFILNLGGALVWLVVNIPILFYIGKRQKSDSDRIADYERMFKKFVIFCGFGLTFFVVSLAYLVLFSRCKYAEEQVFVQFLYNITGTLIKELLFTISDGNNLAIYYVEFSANFYTLMALPSLVTPLAFSFSLLAGLSSFIYQFCRLTTWWFHNIEEKLFAKLRKYFLRQLDKNSLIYLREETIVAPFHSTVVQYACIDDYYENVLRTFFFTALAKAFAPIGFVIYFGFLTYYSQNRQMYPWKIGMSRFETILQYAMITFLVYTTLSSCLMYLIWKRWRVSPKHVIQYTKNNFLICFVCVLGAFIVPFTVLEKHYHTLLWTK